MDPMVSCKPLQYVALRGVSRKLVNKRTNALLIGLPRGSVSLSAVLSVLLSVLVSVLVSVLSVCLTVCLSMCLPLSRPGVALARVTGYSRLGHRSGHEREGCHYGSGTPCSRYTCAATTEPDTVPAIRGMYTSGNAIREKGRGGISLTSHVA